MQQPKAVRQPAFSGAPVEESPAFSTDTPANTEVPKNQGVVSPCEKVRKFLNIDFSNLRVSKAFTGFRLLNPPKTGLILSQQEQLVAPETQPKGGN